MQQRRRQILVIDFIREETPREVEFQYESMTFSVVRYAIGWDFDTAAQLIRKFDGYSDAIVLAGIAERASFAGYEVALKPVSFLRSLAKKSLVYLGEEMDRLFANWTLRRVDAHYPEVFRGRKVLFHFAIFSPFAQTLIDFGARVAAADPLIIFQQPRRLEGPRQISTFLKMISPLLRGDRFARHDYVLSSLRPNTRSTLAAWIRDVDVFVTFSQFLGDWVDPKLLANKVLVVDRLSAPQRNLLKSVGVAQVVELLPDVDFLETIDFRGFGLLTAVMDLFRISEGSSAPLQEYALDLVERMSLNVVPFQIHKPLVRRCAFVLHPLTSSQLFGAPQFRWLETLPRVMRDPVEKGLSYAPLRKVGQVRGAISASNGQEVICDLYGMPATPRRILEMDSGLLYSKLTEAATRAHQEGSLLFGLGAYTKIAGDAGVTVSRLAPLPVTTGNSYSAAATLWSAYETVEKLGFVKRTSSGKLDCVAMVIGATGSIGRVSSLLLAEEVSEVVLVAPRPEKLLELRDEVFRHAPGAKVTIRTDPNTDLPRCAVVVLATSNTRGSVLDIMRVRPGCVVCDCSRPLDISKEEAMRRPDVLVIESGEIELPGNVEITIDIGLPKPTVYACLAETIILTMEGRFESFSLSRHLDPQRVRDIYEIGLKHGARLAPVQSDSGMVSSERIDRCRRMAEERLRSWVDLGRSEGSGTHEPF